MKVLRYEVYQSAAENGEAITLLKELPWSEKNEKNARAEAYNGEITVEDILDPVTEPTADEKRDAQIFYTAMMTDTLLEEV